MLRPFRLDREEFYQLFVHGIKDDRPLVLMLKKDELGQALRDNVQEKCPKLPSAFILLHQGRKVLLSSWTSSEYFFSSFLLTRKFPFFIPPNPPDSTSFLDYSCRRRHELRK